MGSRSHVGRVGNLAVALGVGVAVFTGWGCAVAYADDTGGPAAGSDSSTQGAGPAKARRGADRADAGQADEGSDPSAEVDPAPKSRAGTTHRLVRKRDRVRDEAPAGDVAVDTQVQDQVEVSAGGDADEAPPTPVDEPTADAKPAEPQSRIKFRQPPATPVGHVTLSTPGVPDPVPAPAVTPTLWTLMGAARRASQNEDDATSLDAPASAQTTSELLDITVPAGEVVYTDKPSFFDRTVVLSLRVIRGVSDFIHVDLYGVFAKLLEKDKPPSFMTGGLDAHKTQYVVPDGSTWDVWEFHPPNPTGKTVVAIHGGGFLVQPLATHWYDYTSMARRTGATVLVPMYPLATTEAGSATKVVPATAQFIADQIAARGAENVNVYADSAGTILAMSALRELVLTHRSVPASLVLLSPAPDASLSNPAIRDIKDPVINVDNLDFYNSGGFWAKGFDPKDPIVSPLFIEPNVLAQMPPTTIYIGSLEIGLPDTLLFQQKWTAAGGDVGVVVGQGEIHDWALAGSINTQTDKVRPDIYRELGLTGVAEQTRGRPTLLNVVGSFFWGLFDLGTKLVDFPPKVPPGSTLTAGRSKLEIDCGDGYTADADWYFPTEGEPDKFIYFQHGFPARAGFYNVTLQQLAERNNAIVVAPSITSNIFACDACAASGEPMQAAVARLFEGDRAALLASARAAGYEGTLPDEFVFTGQSAGAPLAVAAARYYYQSATADEEPNLVGVILYDVSNTGGAAEGSALSNALDILPTSIPILNITAEPSAINTFGNANPTFAEKRPGQFNGVQLVGGAHSDAFQSDVLYGIPQLLVSVLFGFSAPENVEAVQVLTTGWLVDMYAGRVYDASHTGIYGDPGAPGQVIVDIPTVKGIAHGYVLPAPIKVLTPFNRLINAFLGLINVNYYANCVADPVESASAQSTLSCSA